MSSFPDSPANIRRLRGTKFYVIRNYWAVTMLSVAGLTLIPFAISDKVRENTRSILNNFLPSIELAESRRYKYATQFSTINSEDVAKEHVEISSEFHGALKLDKYDNISKAGKPDVGKV